MGSSQTELLPSGNPGALNSGKQVSHVSTMLKRRINSLMTSSRGKLCEEVAAHS